MTQPERQSLVISVTSAKSLPNVDPKTDVRLEVSVGKLKARSLPARTDKQKIVKWEFLWKDYPNANETSCVIKVKKHNQFTGYSLVGSAVIPLKDVKDSSPDEGSWISLLGPEKRETGAKLKCAVWWSADNAIEGAVAGVADIYDDREDVEPDAASRVAMKSVNFGSDATHHSSASANKAGTSRLAANTMSFTNDTSMTAVRSINTSNLDCIERNYSVVESLPVPKEVTVIDNRRDSESLDEGTPGTKSSASAQKADRCSITAMKSETSSVLDGQNMLRYTSSDGADIIGIAVNLNGHDYDADRGSLTAIRSININNLDDVNDEEYMQQYDGKEIPNMEGTKIGNNNEERRTNDSQSDIFSEARSQLATDEFEELQRVLRRFDENEKGKEQKSDMRETVVAAAVLKSKVKRLERENAKLVSRVSELEHEREVPA